MNNNINEYITTDNQMPYSLWLDGIKDKIAKARIIAQVDRIELGNFGNSESIGEGISELKIHYGPGYRIYYAKEATNVYLLLCGGSNSTQKSDIRLAKRYWNKHKNKIGA